MTNIAVRVENISKRYRIGLKEELHDSMLGAIGDFATRPLRNLKRLRRLSKFDETGTEAKDILWAIQDVSFEVARGETLGIIGRNGAGKSTLLKVLARITEPTRGRAEIRGRVSSLLEVGTGFHPELTGRENVYLNGTILGMSKSEIDSKFDEIVDFSGVERFLDTPVKRYSSGMAVRLAFSVAAHLEPEVLIIDEVLAVGDAVFQRKCLGRMTDLTGEGRTVLFVSHNMAAITAFTRRCLLLDDGHLIMDGDTETVIAQYLQSGLEFSGDGVFDLRNLKPGNDTPGDMKLLEIAFLDRDGAASRNFAESEPITLRVTFEVRRPTKQFFIGVTITSAVGIRLFSIHSPMREWRAESGVYSVTAAIDPNPLRPGTYGVSMGIDSGVWQDGAYDLAFFEVSENPEIAAARYRTKGGNFGAFYLPFQWQIPEPGNPPIPTDSGHNDDLSNKDSLRIGDRSSAS